MNELLYEIDELEDTIDTLKKIDKPEAILAIRSLDSIIERKKNLISKFEKQLERECSYVTYSS